MSDFAYNTARLGIANGAISLPNSTLKVMLVSTGYLSIVEDTRNNQDFVYDTVGSSSQSPVAFEISTGSGYSRQLLGARTITESDANNRAEIDASDVLFAAVSSGAGVIGAAVVFAELANSDSSGRRLIACYESGFPVTPNGGDITLVWNANGFLQLTT